VLKAEPNDWVEVGRVSRPHGIRGELRVKLHNPDSEILLRIDKVRLHNDQGSRLVDVRGARRAADGIVLMALEGIGSRSEAEAHRGMAILVPRDVLPKAQDNEFYVHDILGAKVVDSRGHELGKVVDYISYPSTDVLVVQGDKRFEIPLIDDFVRSIDSVGRIVTVEGVDDFEA
jgi:16S rRNA processing protein RimM